MGPQVNAVRTYGDGDISTGVDEQSSPRFC